MKFRIHSIAILLILTAACNNITQDNTSTQNPEIINNGNDETTLGEDQDASIRMVVLTLFDGVRESDRDKILSTLTTNAEFISARKNGEELVEKTTRGDEFAEKAGAPHEEVWDERLSDIRVDLQGSNATLLANYEFYLGPKYSHKGEMKVNLTREDSGWLIQKVWYTVVKE